MTAEEPASPIESDSSERLNENPKNEASSSDDPLDYIPPRPKPKTPSQTGNNSPKMPRQESETPPKPKPSESTPPKPRLDLSDELKAAKTEGWFAKMEPLDEKLKRLTHEKNRPLILAIISLVFLIIVVGIIGYSLIESGFKI